MESMDRRKAVKTPDVRLRNQSPFARRSTAEGTNPATAGEPITLFIPGIPLNSNASRQWARMAKAANNKKFRTLSADIANQWRAEHPDFKPWPFTTVTAQHIQIRSKLNRRRDPLGLAERLKGVMDGLVDAGLLVDDDENHIQVVLAHSAEGKEPGIRLTLTPVHVLG